MGDEDRWNKVREIVREECERIEGRILEVIAKHGSRQKLGFVNGKWTGITPEQREVWAAAYGAVDIEGELKKAAAWIVSNPHLAPKSQLGRFLNTWFSRTQDRSSIRSIPSQSSEPPKRKLCEYCDKVATGNPNRTWACDEHFEKAMHHEPVPIMRGVVAKNVTGER